MAFDPNQGNRPGVAAIFSEEVELHISCNDLKKKDMRSDSDPFVIVYEKRTNRIDKKTGEKVVGFVELGRTETFQDNPNPIFETVFKFDYYFEETQTLRFDCFDYDSAKKHELIGSCTMEVGEVLHSGGSIKRTRLLSKKGKPLKNKATKMYQTLTARIEKPKNSNRDVLFQIGCTKLPKMDTFGSCDAYFKIYRVNDSTKQNILLFNRRVTTDDTNKKDGWVVWNSKKPVWPKFSLSLQSLCECNINDECILIEVWDADKDSNDDMVGCVRYKFSELESKTEKALLKEKHKNKERGRLVVLQCDTQPSMVDFIQGGCNLSMGVAIDFTGSNGDPRDDISLHNVGKNGVFSGKPSQYQQAIRVIGNIVSVYDSDQKFPVFGFGIATKEKGKKWQTHHSMALNKYINKKDNEEVVGIYGIEKLYLKTIHEICNNENIVFSGPTNFSSVLSEASGSAKDSLNFYLNSNKEAPLQYHILLLLTDGAITPADKKSTCQIIRDAANGGYPLSIIIVGIGDADFGFLEDLDGDNNELGNMSRDIVQFVKFNDYKKAGDQDRLAKDTLKEVPTQFMSFVQMNKVPTPKRTVAKNIKNEFALSDLEQKDTIYDSNQLIADLESDANGYKNQNQSYGNAPLPPGWERSYTGDGKMYYVNHRLKQTQWMHPDDPGSPQQKAAATGWDENPFAAAM